MPINSSATHGLEIGRRALQAQQAAINTTGNNIANANTPGFSRRQVNLEHAIPHVNQGIGTGADAATVVRQRSSFVDAQARVQQQVLGHWEAFEQGMRSLEAVFNEPTGAGSSEAGTVFSEPSGVGLSGSLSRFWNTWQDLANQPESGAARAAVRQEGEFMANTFHRLHGQLLDTRVGMDQQVQDLVDEVNGLLDQLAAVNAQIPKVRFDAKTAPDLEDQRDRLVDDLSRLVDVSLLERENGQVSVLLAGHNLVEREQVIHLRIRQVAEAGSTTGKVAFADDGSLAGISEGALRGVMEVRDSIIPMLSNRLDEMAGALVQEVNLTHREGYGRDGSTGMDFFAASQTDASNIALSQAVVEDLNNIAASGDGNSGDNSVALAISGLRNRPMLANGTTTAEGFYNELLGEVGARSQEAQTMAENNRLFALQIENRRQSIQGVSLNDEAAQLVLFQRAYQAAARSVSIIDDLLEVTVNI